jgi:glyoxylase-like metal-dependent hydrolase (beta-lactamase superfamily II)
MRLGRFDIESLSEGHFIIHEDGRLQKSVWNPSDADSGDPSRDVIVGIEPVLLMDDKHVILLDAGIGMGLDAGSPAPGVSNIRTNLEIFELKPEDVTHVILSHLHYDHAAGLSYTDQSSTTISTLPNARIFVQQREWDYAVSQMDIPNAYHDAGYVLDDLFRLKASGQLECVRQDSLEIVPGVSMVFTGGHTPGHQITRIADGGRIAYFMGDMLPNEEFFQSKVRPNWDTDALYAARMKGLVMRQAYREKAYILLYHSLFSRTGMLERHAMGSFGLRDE